LRAAQPHSIGRVGRKQNYLTAPNRLNRGVRRLGNPLPGFGPEQAAQTQLLGTGQANRGPYRMLRHERAASPKHNGQLLVQSESEPVFGVDYTGEERPCRTENSVPFVSALELFDVGLGLGFFRLLGLVFLVFRFCLFLL